MPADSPSVSPTPETLCVTCGHTFRDHQYQSASAIGESWCRTTVCNCAAFVAPSVSPQREPTQEQRIAGTGDQLLERVVGAFTDSDQSVAEGITPRRQRKLAKDWPELYAALGVLMGFYRNGRSPTVEPPPPLNANRIADLEILRAELIALTPSSRYGADLRRKIDKLIDFVLGGSHA